MSADTVNKERALFLKQLAKDVNVDIDQLAGIFNIPVERAWVYIKTFISEAAQHPANNYLHVQTVFNRGLEAGYRLEESEMERLGTLLEKYGELAQVEQRNQALASNSPSELNKSSIAAGFNNPAELNTPAAAAGSIAHETVMAEQQQPKPEEAAVYDYARYQVDTLNKGYDFSWLGELTRVGLMRWVLRGVPNPPPPQKVESFIRYFELNQDAVMSSPQALYAELKDFFSEAIALNAAKAVNTYIKWLKPHLGFGMKQADAGVRQGYGPDPNMQTAFSRSQMFEDPFNTSWHHEGVLPYGMSARTPDAQRLIFESQQKKRRKQEREEEQHQLMEEIRTNMQLQVTKLLDPKMMGGFGGMMGGNGHSIDSLMMPLVMTGKAKAIPYIDPQDGQQHLRYEMLDTPLGGAGAMADPDRLTAKDILEVQARMFDMVNSKRDENSTLREQMFTQMMELVKDRSLPMQFMEMSKIMKEMNPPQQSGGGLGGTIEAAKVMLEARKVESDNARADKLLERQYESKDKLQTLEFEKEKEANDMRKTLIQSVSQMIAANLPVFFQLLLILTGRGQMASSLGGGGGAGGGNPLGGLMNMLGGMMGGGGGGAPGGGLGSIFSKMFGGGEGEEGGEAPASATDIFSNMGANRAAQQTTAPQGGGGGTDFNSLFSSILGGGQQQASPPPAATNNPVAGMGPQPAEQLNPSTNFDAMAANQERLYQQRNRPGMTAAGVGVGGMYDDLSGVGPFSQQGQQPEPEPIQQQQVIQEMPKHTVIPSRAEIEQTPTGFNGEQYVKSVVENVAQKEEEQQDEYQIYTPESFQQLTREQIADRLAEAKSTKAKYDASIASFIMSAEEAAKQK